MTISKELREQICYLGRTINEVANSVLGRDTYVGGLGVNGKKLKIQEIMDNFKLNDETNLKDIEDLVEKIKKQLSDLNDFTGLFNGIKHYLKSVEDKVDDIKREDAGIVHERKLKQ